MYWARIPQHFCSDHREQVEGQDYNYWLLNFWFDDPVLPSPPIKLKDNGRPMNHDLVLGGKKTIVLIRSILN